MIVAIYIYDSITKWMQRLSSFSFFSLTYDTNCVPSTINVNSLGLCCRARKYTYLLEIQVLRRSSNLQWNKCISKIELKNCKRRRRTQNEKEGKTMKLWIMILRGSKKRRKDKQNTWNAIIKKKKKEKKWMCARKQQRK